MKRNPSPVNPSKTATSSGASAIRDMPSSADLELIHQMTQIAAYLRAERRGFAVPELRDKVIRKEAARRKRFDGGDVDAHLLKAESEVDLMLQGAAEVQSYADRLATLLGNWDEQLRHLKSELENRKIEIAEFEKKMGNVVDNRIEICDKLQALRGYHGEVWGELKDSIDQAFERMVKTIESIASNLRRDNVTAAKRRDELLK